MLELVFLVDMMVTFRLAYMDGLQMVTSKRRIGLHYLRSPPAPRLCHSFTPPPSRPI